MYIYIYVCVYIYTYINIYIWRRRCTPMSHLPPKIEAQVDGCVPHTQHVNLRIVCYAHVAPTPDHDTRNLNSNPELQPRTPIRDLKPDPATRTPKPAPLGHKSCT